MTLGLIESGSEIEIDEAAIGATVISEAAVVAERVVMRESRAIAKAAGEIGSDGRRVVDTLNPPGRTRDYIAFPIVMRPVDDKRARIYSVVVMIPTGSVSTYGRVATLAGLPRQARQVGYALAALPEDNDVPWHRVVNAKGEISRRTSGEDGRRQRAMLEAEGVAFEDNGRISLARFGWPRN